MLLGDFWFREAAPALDEYYRDKERKPTRHFYNLRDAFKHVLWAYGPHDILKDGEWVPAWEGYDWQDLTPKKLKRVREFMIRADLCLNTVNTRINRIRACCAWGVAEELVDASVLTGLKTVRALAEGRCAARVTDDVAPVAWDVVEATLKHLPAVLQAMVLIQWYTGMRPSEVCRIRPGSISRTEYPNCWIYTPFRHKNTWRGKKYVRKIAVGPKAQAVLRPYLLRPDDAPCFQHGRTWVPGPGTYTANTYAAAIKRAAKLANMPHWYPLQVRHSTGTMIRKMVGLEAAQVVLGHQDAETTEIYAKADEALAVEVMAKYG